MIANPAPPSPAPRGWLQRHWGLLVVLAAILLVAFVRIRLRDCPLERDEGEYAYAGQLMLQGIPPYQLAYNMKFPGTYAAYALIMAVFGQTPAGIHLGVMCVTSLTALMMYWLGRQMMDETAGAVAGTTSVFLSASPSMLGLAGHATHFAGFFVAAGLCLLWQAWHTRQGWAALASGALFSLAVLMKQHAIFICLWGIAVLAVAALRPPQGLPAKKWLLPAWALLGTTLPFGITGLLLWHAGVFGKFWFWTIDYARVYVSAVPLETAPAAAFVVTYSVAAQCCLIWLLAIGGFVTLWFDRRLAGFRIPLACFGLASYLTVFPGLYFRFHYFLLMIPAVALLAGCAVSRLWLISRQRLETSPLKFWLVPGYAFVLVFSVWGDRDLWFQFTPRQAIQALYGPEAFSEFQNIADFVRTNSTPADRIAVLGSEPELYFLSQRHSATGYLHMYPLVEHQAYTRRMQQEMISEIESTRPKFIIFMRLGRSWVVQKDFDTGLVDWWSKSYQKKYVVVGMTEMNPPGTWQYFWEDAAARHANISELSSVLIYQRKDSL